MSAIASGNCASLGYAQKLHEFDSNASQMKKSFPTTTATGRGPARAAGTPSLGQPATDGVGCPSSWVALRRAARSSTDGAASSRHWTRRGRISALAAQARSARTSRYTDKPCLHANALQVSDEQLANLRLYQDLGARGARRSSAAKNSPRAVFGAITRNSVDISKAYFEKCVASSIPARPTKISPAN